MYALQQNLECIRIFQFHSVCFEGSNGASFVSSMELLSLNKFGRFPLFSPLCFNFTRGRERSFSLFISLTLSSSSLKSANEEINKQNKRPVFSFCLNWWANSSAEKCLPIINWDEMSDGKNTHKTNTFWWVPAGYRFKYCLYHLSVKLIELSAINCNDSMKIYCYLKVPFLVLFHNSFFSVYLISFIKFYHMECLS